MTENQKARAWDLFEKEVQSAAVIGYSEAPVLVRLKNLIEEEIPYTEEVDGDQRGGQ